MAGKHSFTFFSAFFAGAAAFAPLACARAAGVLEPAGPVAGAERNLIFTLVGIMLAVAIPMFIFLFVIARRYRAGNEKAKYEPDRAARGLKEHLLLWITPAIAVAAMGTITWGAAHALDPYKPLDSNVKPLTVQVVALDWKWLFVYPEQGIASVNLLEFPERTPLSLELTADAPMNSFWVPQLSGQIYAMPGMVNQLHFMADTTGDYLGKAAEINGEGYARMTFDAKSVSQADFDAWVASVKQSSPPLTADAYNALAAPSEDVPPATYSSVAAGLYNNIVMKFIVPSSTLGSSTVNANILQAIPGMEQNAKP